MPMICDQPLMVPSGFTSNEKANSASVVTANRAWPGKGATHASPDASIGGGGDGGEALAVETAVVAMAGAMVAVAVAVALLCVQKHIPDPSSHHELPDLGWS